MQTKYGPTRKIKITDSIRQGGVLSVTMYALIMDETNKALVETDLGVKIPSTIANIKYFIIILFCSNNSQIYWEGLNNPIPVIILNKEGLDNPIPVDILYWEGLYNAISVDIEAN